MRLVFTEFVNNVEVITEKETILIVSDFDTGAGAIPLSTITGKGSVIAGTANGAVAELVVGTDGKALIADSSQPTGLRWGDISGSFGASSAENRTMTGNLVLTNSDSYIQFCDPGGSDRIITLPAEGAVNHPYFIKNTADAFETISVQDDSGTVICSLHRGETTLIVSSSTAWAKTKWLAYKQLWVAGWKPAKTSGCANSAQVEMSTNKTVFDYLAFDKNTIEYAYANVPMPDDYSGGAIHFSPYWFHPAASSYGVSWGLQGVSFSNSESLDAAQGTPQYSNDIGGSTNYLYFGDLSSAITISGNPVAKDLVQFRISRKADDVTNDTLDVDAYLLGTLIWYPVV